MIAGALDVAALSAVSVSSFLALVGTIYSAHRSGRAQERAADATTQAEAVKTTHEALTGTIEVLEKRLDRQAREHSADMALVRGEVSRLSKDVDKCHRERDSLRRQLAKITGGR